jgi:hypothetical protein
MLWFIYLAKLRTDLLDNRSLAILLETYKLLICYTLVFGQPLSGERERIQRGQAGCELVRCRFLWSAVAAELAALYEAMVQRHLTY